MLDTLDPLCVHLHKEVNENAEATSEETNQSSRGLLTTGNQTRCLNEQIRLSIALSAHVNIFYPSKVDKFVGIQLTLLPFMTQLLHLLSQFVSLEHFSAIRVGMLGEHCVNGLLVAVLVGLKRIRNDSKIGVCRVDE